MEAQQKKKEDLSHYGGVGRGGGTAQLVLLSESSAGWQRETPAD